MSSISAAEVESIVKSLQNAFENGNDSFVRTYRSRAVAEQIQVALFSMYNGRYYTTVVPLRNGRAVLVVDAFNCK